MYNFVRVALVGVVALYSCTWNRKSYSAISIARKLYDINHKEHE